jgi:hypothetical protein
VSELLATISIIYMNGINLKEIGLLSNGFQMEKGRVGIRTLFRIGAGILVLVLVTQLMVFSTSEPPVVITGLEWNIKAGDFLTYEINVTGARDDFNEQVSYLWAHLNNTRILVNVTHLPVLLAFYTNEDFIESIVEIPKVTCCFDNGTPLSDSDLFIESLVSRALLPVVPWENFDLLFPDHWNGDWEMYGPDYTWVACFDNGQLFFGHIGESWHFTKGWSARINMTTGVPLMIETHDNYHDAGFTTDVLELILVDHVTS